MKFSITKTYQLVTEESAEHGDLADHGVVWEDVVSLRDLIGILREYSYLSSTHVDSWTWAESDPDLNFSTGAYTTYHLHVNAINGHEPTAHQLRRIYRIAGLV